jgi:hypothetical protein
VFTSSYIRCDIHDGIDLAQAACEARMNVHLYVMWAAAVPVGQLLALQEGSAVGWVTK